MPPTGPDPSSPASLEGPPLVVPTRRVGRIWAVVLGAGLIAGLAAWLGGEAAVGAIKPPRRAVVSKGLALRVTDRWGELTADARNAALGFAILGGAVGAGLGLGGGLVGGSARRGVAAALVGLAAGAIGSAATAAAVLTPFNTYRFQYPDEASRDLLHPLLVRVAIWSVAGIAGGLAFAVGSGLRGRQAWGDATLGGLGGGLIGAMACELVAALALGGEGAGGLIGATATARLLARLAVALGAAAGVALAATRPVRPTPPDPAA